jgi:HK97 family phage prohead protease
MNLDEKLKKHYGVKSIALKMEDIDEKNRIVKGYGSAFDVIDSDMDVIRRGAFAKSLQERGANSSGNRKIAHLRNHDWEHQIGKFLEMEEDEFGLRFVAQLGRSTKGQDALLDYQDGILREHSIGFNYVADKIKFVEDATYHPEGHYEISEVKLWEVSGVTFGANEFTPVIEAAKSGDTEGAVKRFHELEASFLKAIKRGTGTDERLENLEARFKQLQELRNSLFVEKPSLKDTLKAEKPNDNDKKELFLNLLND